MAVNEGLVGIRKVKPVVQEFFKLCSGGMIAVSSAILLFAIQGDTESTTSQLIMLSLHALAIPLLVAGRAFNGIFDAFSAVPEKLGDRIERLIELGIFFAMIGYMFAIMIFSKILFWAFFVGVAIVVCYIKSMEKHMDDPRLVRRG